MKVKIHNEYDKVFLEKNDGFKSIRDNVVTEIQKESLIVDILKNKSDDISRDLLLYNALSEVPEIMKVNILGLEIDIALIEDLSHSDLLKGSWDVLFKINRTSPEFGLMGMLYNSVKDGVDSFSYDEILSRLEVVIKKSIELENC